MFRDLKRVEIELHSFCNRKCQWCPNKDDLRSFYKEMPEDAFLRLIHNLKEHHFDNQITRHDAKIITFNGYCEPLYNVNLIQKRAAQLLEIMPTVTISINTNGDYLEENILDNLCLERINIMDYDNKGKEYWREQFKTIGVTYLGETGTTIYGTHKNINKIECFINWPQNTEIEDRAGYLWKDISDKKGHRLKWKNDKTKRNMHCYEPLFFPSIEFNGNVMPCCHMRSDIQRYEDYVLGNINQNSLSDIYKDNKWTQFRELILGDVNSYPIICKYCQKERPIGYYSVERIKMRDSLDKTCIGLNRNQYIAKFMKRRPR